MGYPKMVGFRRGKSHQNGWLGGIPISGNPQTPILESTKTSPGKTLEAAMGKWEMLRDTLWQLGNLYGKYRESIWMGCWIFHYNLWWTCREHIWIWDVLAMCNGNNEPVGLSQQESPMANRRFNGILGGFSSNHQVRKNWILLPPKMGLKLHSATQPRGFAKRKAGMYEIMFNRKLINPSGRLSICYPVLLSASPTLYYILLPSAT